MNRHEALERHLGSTLGIQYAWEVGGYMVESRDQWRRMLGRVIGDACEGKSLGMHAGETVIRDACQGVIGAVH